MHLQLGFLACLFGGLFFGFALHLPFQFKSFRLIASVLEFAVSKVPQKGQEEKGAEQLTEDCFVCSRLRRGRLTEKF